MEKYIAYLHGIVEDGEEPVIAMKYDSDEKRFTIGGYHKFRRNIVTLLSQLFNIEISDRGRQIVESKAQRNKIRFDIAMNSREAYAGLNAMEAAGITLKNVKSLERIMR